MVDTTKSNMLGVQYGTFELDTGHEETFDDKPSEAVGESWWGCAISIFKDLFFCDSVVLVWNTVAGCVLQVSICDNNVIISPSLVFAT